MEKGFYHLERHIYGKKETYCEPENKKKHATFEIMNLNIHQVNVLGATERFESQLKLDPP